jgi:hypothetical protein
VDAGIDGYQLRGSVTGTVFNDLDGNGTQDAGEPGLAGVTVLVNGTVVVTGPNGDYTVTGLPAGPVTVDVDETTLPAGMALTTGNDPVTVTVTGGGTTSVDTGYRIPNRPPVADDDSATTPPATPVRIEVLVGDSDPDSDPLTIISTTSPANGTVTVNLDGTISYTPNAGFTGVDSFTYTISDGRGGAATATVTVTVPATDHVPVAVPDTNRITQGDGCAGGTPTCASGNVLTNDTGLQDGPLTVRVVNPPANGTVVLGNDGIYIYRPDLTFTGTDVFTYEVCDRDGQCSQTTVTIVVDPPAQPPATDLQILITTDTPPTPNGRGTYTVTITNRSTVTETGPVVVTIQLPPGTLFDGKIGTDPEWTCTAEPAQGGGQTVTCTNPNPLVGGGSSDFRIGVVYPPSVSGPIQIEGQVTGVVRDTVPTNNRTQVVVTGGGGGGRGGDGGNPGDRRDPGSDEPDLPRTGQPIDRLVSLALALLLMGATFVATTARRRERRSATHRPLRTVAG